LKLSEAALPEDISFISKLKRNNSKFDGSSVFKKKLIELE